jgi:hypothetical protein
LKYLCVADDESHLAQNQRPEMTSFSAAAAAAPAAATAAVVRSWTHCLLMPIRLDGHVVWSAAAVDPCQRLGHRPSMLAMAV